MPIQIRIAMLLLPPMILAEMSMVGANWCAGEFEELGVLMQLPATTFSGGQVAEKY